MKPNIDWRRAALTGLRIALTGTSQFLAVSGQVLQITGTVCEKLRVITQSQAERLSSVR